MSPEKQESNSKDNQVKAAVVAGIFAVLAAAIAGGVTLATSNSHASQQSSDSPISSSQPAPSSPAVSQPAITEPLSFYNVSQDAKVGPLIQPLIVKGTVPPGERPWVLVKSSGDYFVQGPLSPTSQASQLWTLSTVSLGSAQGPLNTPYVIYVVLADSRASSAIQTDYKHTDNGNTGTSQIPGGPGIKVACDITVVRTH